MTPLNLYQLEAKIENLGKPKALQTKMQKVSKNWIELSDIDRKNYEDKLKQTDVIIEMMRKLEGKEKLGENAENEGQNMEKMEEKEEKMEKKDKIKLLTQWWLKIFNCCFANDRNVYTIRYRPAD